MNRNAVIQRFQFPYTPNSTTRVRGFPANPDTARIWVTSNTGTDAVLGEQFEMYGSIDGVKFNRLPSINDPLKIGNFLIEETPGTLFNVDVRGQSELAYTSTSTTPSGLATLNVAMLPLQGARRVRGRLLDTQTIVPSNPSTPFAGTSKIVDCADVDTLSIQCTDTNSQSTVWSTQGSIDGEYWWAIPVVGQQVVTGLPSTTTIAGGTFVRNLDVSGYRYIRLLLNGTTASPFNTIATFYGEALE